MFLNEKHRDEFHSSGISDDTINKYATQGYFQSVEDIQQFVKEKNLKISSQVGGSGWIMFYPNSNYYIFKADNPRCDDRGKPIKYETPYETQTDLFYPIDFDINKDKVIITEGIKKAIKAVQEGYNTVSVSGCWNWKSKSTEDGINENFKKLVEMLKQASHTEVYLCYDNDLMFKPQVRQALIALSDYLLNNDILCKIIYLPYNKGQKLGLDDYLAKDNANLDKLIEKAMPLPETLISYVLKGRKLNIGKAMLVDIEKFGEKLKNELQYLPEKYFEFSKEVYLYYRQKEKKYIIKKTNFAFEVVEKIITIRQEVENEKDI